MTLRNLLVLAIALTAFTGCKRDTPPSKPANAGYSVQTRKHLKNWLLLYNIPITLVTYYPDV